MSDDGRDGGTHDGGAGDERNGGHTGRYDGGHDDGAGDGHDVGHTDGRDDGAGDVEPTPTLSVRDLSVSYGDATVVDGVDLTVGSTAEQSNPSESPSGGGELVGLVGPNGAGKTTLLHAISGAVEPDRGQVLVEGDDVRALSAAAVSRRIAVVPQETTLHFSFSVRQLVEMGRHPHRSRFELPTSRDRRLVDDAMERTRVARFAERTIDEVSGGERQRVLLARALAQDAPVLLLDEPTASLDLQHAVETMTLVRDLVDEGRTAVAAIHDLELAARFCDRVVVLAGGAVVAAGPPERVLDASHIDAAFDARVAVEPEPVGGGVAVRTLTGGDLDVRVHVLGGGQPAARALGVLGDAGATLSLGPVPDGDRALATARALGADVVTTAPFQAVDADALDRSRSLATAADVVVLADSLGSGCDDRSADDAASDVGRSSSERGSRPAAWDDVCAVTQTLIVVSRQRAVPRPSDGLPDERFVTSFDDLPSTVAAVASHDDGSAPADLSADERPPDDHERDCNGRGDSGRDDRSVHAARLADGGREE